MLGFVLGLKIANHLLMNILNKNMLGIELFLWNYSKKMSIFVYQKFKSYEKD